jgi:DMSO/TMAO reductase YedYZ molybdopterin-dependent catalytic subunit
MREIGLSELLSDPERAGHLLSSRRGFLSAGVRLGAGAMALRVAHLGLLPAGLVPVAWGEQPVDALLAEKPGLRLLNDRPLNAETPAHLLDDAVTPAARLFVRNNGIPPQSVDPATWTLRVHGESCRRPRSFSIAELQRSFEPVTLQLTLECGGNGRSEFRPRVPGNQWTTGAVGCPRFTGVRLRDLLAACDLRDDAVYVGYVGADTHLSGDPGKQVISRGVPIAKALEAETLLAWAMNDEPLPAVHGAPLRLVCAGFPASASGKWVTDILIRDRVHDGEKMGGSSYRVPCTPVAPGAQVADADLCIIETMPVKSLITSPRSGVRVDAARALTVRGHAWAGAGAVARVELSTDFGATWQATRLAPPANRLAWQHWETQLRFSQPGYHELWARATDAAGRAQPMLVPGWNPKGYLNNATHRIAVQVQTGA